MPKTCAYYVLATSTIRCNTETASGLSLLNEFIKWESRRWKPTQRLPVGTALPEIWLQKS